MLAARVAESLAAGVVQPIPAIITRNFGTCEQGQASGICGMGVMLSPAIGPSIGGEVVESFGLRSIFVSVVPFCWALPWLGYCYVRVTASDNVAANRKEASLDWGALLMGGAIGVSLCGIILEWRLASHGNSLTLAATSPARLAAFNDTFMMLVALCALALLAAWRLRAIPVAGAPGPKTES